MVTLQEVELMAGILQRAGVSQIEALFLNSVLERLRAIVTPELPPGEDEPEKPKAA